MVGKQKVLLGGLLASVAIMAASSFWMPKSYADWDDYRGGFGNPYRHAAYYNGGGGGWFGRGFPGGGYYGGRGYGGWNPGRGGWGRQAYAYGWGHGNGNGWGRGCGGGRSHRDFW